MHKRRWEEAGETALAVPLFPVPFALTIDDSMELFAMIMRLVDGGWQGRNLTLRPIVVSSSIGSRAGG